MINIYYTNITNSELQQFHKVIVPNFTIKLTDVLTSALFKVETIVTGSIYRVYPLFYTNEITSSNPHDNILDTQCIICQKTSDETYITFISNPSEPINDYSNYASYFDVSDTLTTAEFNNIISLLRHNTINNDSIRINDLVTGVYGTYEFDIIDTTILDNGIVVSDETILAEPKVRLTNPAFHKSTYTLQLKVLHYTDVNILDDNTDDYTVIDTLEIELTEDEWVDIPVTDIEQGYIILFNSNVEITHNKNIIQDWITHLQLSVPKPIIQTSEKDDITVKATDDMGNPISNKVIYFFEEYEPTTLTLSVPSSIIQTGDHNDITAKLKDEDGSLIQGETIYFYEMGATYFNDGTDTSSLIISDGVSVTVDNGALKITTSTNTEKYVVYPVDFTSNDNFIVEWEIAQLGNIQSFAGFLKQATTVDGVWWKYDNSNNRWDGGINGVTFNQVNVGVLQVGDIVSLKQNNGVISLYVNDNLITSNEANFEGSYRVGNYTNKSRIQYLKNIRIKEIGED